MDILIISLGSEGSPATSEKPAIPARAPNRFVLQNVARFQRLLGPCLRADTPGIRQRVLRLVERLAALYGPSCPPIEFQESKFWENFQGSVERRLKAALSEKHVPPASHPGIWHGSAAASVPIVAQMAAAAASPAGAPGSGGVVGAGGDADRSKALLSVKVVGSVAAVYPAFAEPHAASLLELAKTLRWKHFQRAALTAASLLARYGGNTAAGAPLPSGMAMVDPASPSARLLPTPALAVLNTAVTVDVVADDAVLTEHLEVGFWRGGEARGCVEKPSLVTGMAYTDIKI